MKTVFAYIRVSTQKQGVQGSSLQEQRASISAYAAQHGLTIAEWFEEMETAAKGGRPKFRKMIQGLDTGVASGVVIHKIDRGARNLRDWADLGDLIDRGVEVHFAHESLDLHSRGGRLSADIQAVVAADFIRNLRQEVKKASTAASNKVSIRCKRRLAIGTWERPRSRKSTLSRGHSCAKHSRSMPQESSISIGSRPRCTDADYADETAARYRKTRSRRC